MPTTSPSNASPSSASPSQAAQHLVFFHPDLGIGGAERLIVDATVGLQRRGHGVTIFTSHCDPRHCFDEARDGEHLHALTWRCGCANESGTLDVRVRGNLLPPSLGGRFHILLAILRQIHLILAIYGSGELANLNPTTFVVDQLSAGVPLLRLLFPKVRVLFYCHFPDLLLATQRQAWYQRLWRLPFDALEGWSMRGADRLLVNSQFTADTARGVWPDFGGERGVGIVYPCVAADEPAKSPSKSPRESKTQLPSANGDVDPETPLWPDKKIILSINRFERKKDIGLAIRAFAALSPTVRRDAKLVLAGGYDVRVAENIQCHAELQELATELGLQSATAKNIVTALKIEPAIQVVFLLSVPSQLKTMLLQTARVLVYTPGREHFGIVPLEAMRAGLPVLAASTGGPTETVVDGKTGWLRDVDDISAWTAALKEALTADEAQQKRWAAAGRARVNGKFTPEAMARAFDDEITAMNRRPRVSTTELSTVLVGLSALLLALAASAILLLRRSR